MTPTELILLQRQFRELLWIANKDRETVPFELNEHQLRYLANATNRDIIIKCRQLGFSSVILGLFFLKCLSTPNTNAVIISHDSKSTEKLFSRVHFFAKHCTIPIDTGNSSKYEITFPETDSTFYVGTAGSREFGRGDTITDLHCSEFAFWPNPEQITRGLFQAVPKTGRIVIESTANGAGNAFHVRCLNASRTDASWKRHFYPWYVSTEYASSPVASPEDFELFEEELTYLAKVEKEINVKLSLEQLLWRRDKIEEFGEDRILGIAPERFFDQEYPFSFDSAFLASGTGVFANLGISPSPRPRPVFGPPPPALGTNFIPYKSPDPSSCYVLGCDPAEGLRGDESVIEVFDLNSLEQVAEFASDTTAPDKLADVIKTIGVYYNNAYVVCEINNHGLTTLTTLKKLYPDYLIHKERRLGTKKYSDPTSILLGLRTTQNKAKMVDDLYSFLRDGLIYYSEKLHAELLTFVEIKSQYGNISYGASGNNMDNRVMATVLVIQGFIYFLRSMPSKAKEPDNYLSIKAVTERLRKSNSKESLVESFFAGAN